MPALRRVAFVLDPLATLQPGKDSSIALIAAAWARGVEVFATASTQMWCDADGRVFARGTFITAADGDDWYQSAPEEVCELAAFDIVVMRKDPPIDLGYLACVWMLDVLARSGTVVLNAPQALLAMNEKLAVLAFPELTPPMRVSASPEQLSDFLAQYNEIVIKPLDLMGGRDVRRVSSEELTARDVLEESTQQGTRPLVAQQFLPAVFDGDRRLLLIDGELIPHALVRTPKEGEFRANLALGAHGQVEPVTARDAEIAAALAEPLRTAGVHFAGIDVIGGYLTEINLTSPTGICDIEAAGYPVSEQFWDTAAGRYLS